MLHITGQEQIFLPNVNRLIVSHITRLESAVAGQHYQRQLVFVTGVGTLAITLIAADRETLTLAGE